MKKLCALFLILFLDMLCLSVYCESVTYPGELIQPAYPVPDYVEKLLGVASEEVGYTEGEHGFSKYGEWAGDPYAQWCAEFQC